MQGLNYDTTEKVSLLLDYRSWVRFSRVCKEVNRIVRDQKAQRWSEWYIEKYGTEALDYASKRGNIMVVKWLILSDTKKLETRKRMNIALWSASLNRETSLILRQSIYLFNYVDVMKWLYNEMREDERDSSAWSFTHASTTGNLEAVKFLHSIGGHGDGAIDNASKNGHFKIVKFLHENKVRGCTTKAIDWASENGHFKIVKFLCVHRSEGFTSDAIFGSVRNGHKKITDYLRNYKENIKYIRRIRNG